MLTHLGDTHLAVGDDAAARAAWEPAMAILLSIDVTAADQLLSLARSFSVSLG